MESYKYRAILSEYSKGRFNYCFAKIVGIVPAVYFEELLTQYFNVCMEKEYFMPKYTDVERLLNITKEEQDSYIGSFKNLGLIEQDGKTIRIIIDNYMRLIFDDSEESVCNYKKKASEGLNKVIDGKAKKIAKVKDNLKNQIRGNNVELRKLYFTWIDAIVDKYGILPNETAFLGQSMAMNYAKGDINVEKAVLEKAIINVFKDMSWAINAFEKTLTIEGNLASANPVTLTQPIDVNPSVEEDYEVTFGGVV